MKTPLQPTDLRTVYGSVMHHASEINALGAALQEPPYGQAPQAPVLYIKPSNTFSAFGSTLDWPAQPPGVRHALPMHARACIGLIYQENKPLVGKKSSFDAIDFVVSIFCDFTFAQPNYFRPPVKFNAFDGALALPDQSLLCTAADLQNLTIETWINEHCAHSYRSADWLTSAQQHLQAVNDFIAFESGDVLLLGCPPDAPQVQAGDLVQARVAQWPCQTEQRWKAAP
jgi:5-oxopent-3-ene-1,2,5-tricarboxylate decarboxylase / 2-hydroxyhepta-2,4-diene-1,7-dioate isomerase